MEWSPTSVFEEPDGSGQRSPGYDDVDGGGFAAPVASYFAAAADEGFGMKKIGNEICDILMDPGEKRRAGIGLVGRLLNRKYRRSRAAKVEAQMEDIGIHR